MLPYGTDGDGIRRPVRCWLEPTVRVLDQGIIQERDIRVADLPAYRKICLFNAMLDFEEVVTDVSRILIPPAHNC